MSAPSNGRRVLVLFAHPALERSRVHRQLVRQAQGTPGVSVRDLYELYPDFDVQPAPEQAALAEHDVIVLQHPIYWYSVPALMKQYLDVVLEYGWAYGKGGDALAGKYLLPAVSTGGGAEAYTHEGLHQATLEELLAPVRQTARLCKMCWLPPIALHGAHHVDERTLAAAAAAYGQLLAGIAAGTLAPEAIADEPAVGWLRDLTADQPEAIHA